MAMSKLERGTLMQVLENKGLPGAVYDKETDTVCLPQGIGIYKDSTIRYKEGQVETVYGFVAPAVREASEALRMWEQATPMEIEGLQNYRKLAEYGRAVLAARDDSSQGRGLYFATWEYNRDKTALDHGHYTADYASAKEDFAFRADLVNREKVVNTMEAPLIADAVRHSLDRDNLSYQTEQALEGILSKMEDVCRQPEIFTAEATAKQSGSLLDKLHKNAAEAAKSHPSPGKTRTQDRTI